jgi:hypothetical protein
VQLDSQVQGGTVQELLEETSMLPVRFVIERGGMFLEFDEKTPPASRGAEKAEPKKGPQADGSDVLAAVKPKKRRVPKAKPVPRAVPAKKPRRSKGRGISEDQKARVDKWLKRGKSPAWVAKKVGIKPQAIHSYTHSRKAAGAAKADGEPVTPVKKGRGTATPPAAIPRQMNPSKAKMAAPATPRTPSISKSTAGVNELAKRIEGAHPDSPAIREVDEQCEECGEELNAMGDCMNDDCAHCGPEESTLPIKDCNGPRCTVIRAEAELRESTPEAAAAEDQA